MPDFKRCAIALLSSEILLLTSYFFVDFDSYLPVKTTFIILLVVVLIYSVLFLLTQISKKYAALVLVLLMFCEIFCQSFLSLKHMTSLGTYYDDLFSTVTEFQNNDPDFSSDSIFRSRILGMSSKNNELAMNLNGIGAFNIFQNSKAINFLDKCGYFTTSISVEDHGGYKPLDDILGVKKVFSLNNNDYNSLIGNTNIYNNNGLYVFENENSLPLGFGINNDYNILYFFGFS